MSIMVSKEVKFANIQMHVDEIEQSARVLMVHLEMVEQAFGLSMLSSEERHLYQRGWRLVRYVLGAE